MRLAIGFLTRHPFCILAFAGVVLMLPTLLWGPGATHSYLYNYMWTQHFGEQMVAGHIYERWLPRSFEGLGSPTFYFYPPVAYWVSGGFAALGLSVQQAINLAGVTLMIASGMAMYLWLAGRSRLPLVGALLYMAAPYHLYDFHVRGALAEFAAFIWLPLIALAIERLPARRGIALLALGYGGLILTHLPLATLTGLFLIAPHMAHRGRRDRSTLVPGLFAGALAFALAACYLLPAATLQSHMSTALLWTGKYHASGWSIWAEDFEFFPCIAIGLILIAWQARSLWSGIAIFAALASVNLIPLLWQVDLLDKVQFPWRAMGIAEFAAITALMSCRPRAPVIAAAGVILLFPYLYGGFITAANLRLPIDYARLDRAVPDAPEYLPAGFDVALVDRYDRSTDLAAFRTLPRGDLIRVERPGMVTTGHAAFPIWRVTRDGQPVASGGPLIRFAATPGVYRIERMRLWQESVGALLSTLAAIGIGLLAMGRARISHLSKFPPYSPSPAIFDWAVSGWLGRSRHSGGDT